MWPSEEEIRELRRQALGDNMVAQDDDAVWNESRRLALTSAGRIWIPADAIELQQRLCVVSHAGASGYRGVKATETRCRFCFRG